MIIYPAIDIIGGSVVRLLRGNYDSVKKYSLTPEDAALSFERAGATHLHAVDLDGAKSGNTDNSSSVQKIISSTGMFVEIGGGVRTEKRIEGYISAGAGRVILGTAAVRDFDFLKKAVNRFGDKIAVGVDAAEGKVAISGWREVTDTDAFEFCRKLADVGVKYIIYTDISRDGALCGTNLKAYERLVGIDGINVTASGGITYLDEIKTLREMGVYAAILGKSLYENKLSLAEAIAVAEGK